jgi:hypothetical protein
MWYSRTFVNAAGSFARLASVAFGSAAKAALVGANTVSLVEPESAFTSPASLTSETSVDNCGSDDAIWAMFWFDVIDADAPMAGTATAVMMVTIASRRFTSISFARCLICPSVRARARERLANRSAAGIRISADVRTAHGPPATGFER